MNGGGTAEADMRTAAAVLAAGGLKPQDISVALRVAVGQVRAWLSLPHASVRPPAVFGNENA